MTPAQVVQSLRAEARTVLLQTVVGTAVVALLVAGVNFGHAFLSIDGLTFAALDDVIVIGRRNSAVPVPFWTLFWLSMTVVPGLVLAINGWRYVRTSRRAARLAPIVERGVAQPARVVDVQYRSEKRGSMQYEKLLLVAETPSGQRQQAFKEVTVGTALPRVEPNAEASIITLDARVVVVVGAEVFEP